MDFTMFWPGIPLIRLLIVLLVLLFAWGLVQAIVASRKIAEERLNVQRLSKRSDLLEDTRKVVDHLGLTENSLGANLLRSMVKQQGLAFARPSDSLDPVLDAAARILGPARTVPNLLLLLGLIGTVVGLAYTLTSLGPQIQGAINAGDPQAVAKSLGTTLRAMSGAFAGTFWGVTCAFILQAFNAFISSKSEALAADLDELSLLYAPQIYPAGMERQLASLQDILRQSDQFLTQTTEKISETSDKFATVLGEASAIIKESLTTLQSTSENIGKSLTTAAGDVRQSSEKLGEAVKVIQGHSEDFRNIYSSFNDMFERSMNALKLHSDSELTVIRDLQGEFGRVSGEIASEMLKISGKLDLVSQDIATAQSTYLNGTHEVGNTLKLGFNSLDQQLGATLKLYTTEVNAVSSRLDQLTAGLQRSGEASGELTKMLQSKDDAERTRQKDLLDSEKRLMTSTDRLHEQLGLVMTTLEELNPAEAITQALVKLGHQVEQASQGHTEVTRELAGGFQRSLSGQLEEQFGQVRTALVELNPTELVKQEFLKLGGQLGQSTISQIEATRQLGERFETALSPLAKAEDAAQTLTQQQAQLLAHQQEVWQNLQTKLDSISNERRHTDDLDQGRQHELTRLLLALLAHASQQTDELRAHRQEGERLRAALEGLAARSEVQHAASVGMQLAQHEEQQAQLHEPLSQVEEGSTPADAAGPAT